MKTLKIFSLFLFAGMMLLVAAIGVMVSSCEKKPLITNDIVGTWYTNSPFARNNIVTFTEDMRVNDYFPQYLSTDTYFTYALDGDSISITMYQGNFNVTEKFKYTLSGDTLTIYAFSNPFSGTDELKQGIKFTRTPPIPNNILGKWNLIQIRLGFGGTFGLEQGWVTYEFKDNPKIVTVFVSDMVQNINQPFDAPITEGGDYTYSVITDENSDMSIIFSDNSSVYGLRFEENNYRMFIEGNVAADEPSYIFVR